MLLSRPNAAIARWEKGERGGILIPPLTAHREGGKGARKKKETVLARAGFQGERCPKYATDHFLFNNLLSKKQKEKGRERQRTGGKA